MQPSAAAVRLGSELPEIAPPDFVWVVAALMRSHHLPFEPSLLLQQFPPPYDRGTLVEAARAYGFKAGYTTVRRGRLQGLPLPAVAFLKSGPAALILKQDGERLLYVEAGSDVPRTGLLADFDALFEPGVLLAAHERAEEPHAGTPQERPAFGFRWFIPALARHKAIWRDVLLTSLAIQVVGLTTPIFTQVIVDKVVVHHTQSTLIAIAIGLGMFLVFNAVMTWLRQDLKSQEHAIAAARSTIALSERKLAQLTAEYRQGLQAERAELAPQIERLRQEIAKLRHRHEMLELRAPHSGTVKDLATHTPGTVVAPGTILMTIVPRDERLRAEVWLANDDVGFVRAEHPARIKLAAFQFQKYGMLEGMVTQVSADATEAPNPNTRSGGLAGRDRPAGPLAFRTLVDLKAQHLEADGRRYSLAPGMQVVAEIHLGSRTVLEYLLSPVQKAFHEAGRER